MNDAIQILKETLTGDMNVNTASMTLRTLPSEAKSSAVYLPILRTIDCLREKKVIDFCGHLRQCMNYLQSGLDVSDEILQIIERYRERFRFSLYRVEGTNRINIDPNIDVGQSDLSSRFWLKKRQTGKPSVGDGELFRSYGYDSYLSSTQKLLMYMIRNQENNETILACLPTGGGKSLSWELPALSGRLSGLAIVVVPTVALAKDQEKRSEAAFSGKLSSKKSAAYYGSLSAMKKQAILQDVAAGQISVLYISPEALLQQRFKTAVLDAAKMGFIGMLVIDEAHLVVQWGRHFRPEFQLLSSFRDQIQKASPNGLRTLLLSATLTVDDTKVLKQVFGSDSFTEFRGDVLRTEPEFYTHECTSARERVSLVQRLTDLAPRPIIIYVATPSQASGYLTELREYGYRNCEAFSGDTSGSLRDDLIDRWRNNRIDIMVATSAFGVGVDKADIRTIITAYTPESISRFYQEVGRAGRDGYASLNYWLPFSEEDKAIVHDLTKSAVLTEETLAIRWLSLLNASEHLSSDEVWLDMRHAPEHLMFGHTGETNKNWNIDTVLFLSRCGLIEILDSVSQGQEDYRILVRLKNIPVLENKSSLMAQISDQRSMERNSIDTSMSMVRRMIKNPEHYCYADYFVQEFPFAAFQCSGCPACRLNNTDPYYSESNLEIHTTKSSFIKNDVCDRDDLLSSYLQYRNEIHLVTEDTLQGDRLGDCIASLITCGVNIIVYPPAAETSLIVKRLAAVKRSNYLLLSLDEAERLSMKWLEGSCALFYTSDTAYNQRVYSFCERYLRENSAAHVVHIADYNLLIPARHKALRDIVDGSIKLSAIL